MEATRRALLGAARSLFAERGYHGTAAEEAPFGRSHESPLYGLKVETRHALGRRPRAAEGGEAGRVSGGSRLAGEFDR
jgi:hypothetical protein